MSRFNKKAIRKDEWLTPPEIVYALGVFDLDPCAPVNRPWPTAQNHFTINDNGLLLPWKGRVWMNPPYTRNIIPLWMDRISAHGNGCALVFNSSDAAWFQNYVFPYASSLLYIKGRVRFYNVDGTQSKDNGGAPSVLIAYNDENSDAIEDSGIAGVHIPLQGHIIVIGLDRSDKTWRVLVGEAVTEIKGPVSCNDVYCAVIDLAPSKVRNNKNYKAKIRQTLQRYFNKVDKDQYIN